MLDLALRSQLALVFVLAVSAIVLIWLLLKDKIHIEYALLWFFALILGVVIASSNRFLMFMTRLIGAKIPASALAYLGFAFIFFVLIYFSTRISVLSNKLKNLTQYVALLEKELKDRPPALRTEEEPATSDNHPPA